MRERAPLMAYVLFPEGSTIRRFWNEMLEQYYNRDDYERGMMPVDRLVEGRPAIRVREEAAQALADEGAGEYRPDDADAEDRPLPPVTEESGEAADETQATADDTVEE